MSETSSKKFPVRHGTPWSKEEFQQLILAIEQGLTLSDLAERHQRTSGGIYGAIKRLLPSEFFQNNNVGSLCDLVRYFNEKRNQERLCFINALCASAAIEKTPEKNKRLEYHWGVVSKLFRHVQRYWEQAVERQTERK